MNKKNYLEYYIDNPAALDKYNTKEYNEKESHARFGQNQNKRHIKSQASR